MVNSRKVLILILLTMVGFTCGLQAADIHRASYAHIELDTDFSDWSGLSGATDGIGDEGLDLDLSEITLANNDSYLFFNVKIDDGGVGQQYGDSTRKEYIDIYIDIDNNPATGTLVGPAGQQIGAEYTVSSARRNDAISNGRGTRWASGLYSGLRSGAAGGGTPIEGYGNAGLADASVLDGVNEMEERVLLSAIGLDFGDTIAYTVWASRGGDNPHRDWLNSVQTYTIDHRLKLLKTDDNFQIISPGLTFELASKQDGVGFLSIKHILKNIEFVKRPSKATDAKMWRVVLTQDRSKPDEFINIRNFDKCEQKEVNFEDNEIVCSWKGFDVGQEKAVLDVKVIFGLYNSTEMVDWRIEVSNRSEKFGIWHVYGPIIELGEIGESGQDDYLIMPPAEGRSVRDPINWDENIKNERVIHDLTTDMRPVEFKNEQPATGFGFGAQEPFGCPYPTSRGQMQLCGYYQKRGNYYYPDKEKGCGLYLAAHDSHSYPKVFYATNNYKKQLLVFAMGGFPEDSAKQGLSYKQRYPFVIGALDGDWFDAAKIYRSWAIRQMWTRFGTLEQRQDIPDWLTKITAWVRLTTGKEGGEWKKALKLVDKYRDELDGFIGVQWYGWDEDSVNIKKGLGSFPLNSFAQKGFSEAIERFRDQDCIVFPFVNTRLWFHQFEDRKEYLDYEIVKPYLQTGANGEVDRYGKQRKIGFQSRICQQTRFWQDYLREAIEQVVRSYAPGGLYLDQAGALSYGGGYYGLQGCHNAEHGHPLGVTRDLYEVEHEGHKKILAAARIIDPNIVLMAEGGAESFIDVTFNRLIHYEIWPGNVPLFGAVYHDYVTSFGRTVSLKAGNPSDPLPAMQIGWQLILGNQIGRVSAQSFDDPISRKHMDYLVNACKLRNEWHKYLTLGQMMKPPYMSDVPIVTTAEFKRINHLCSLPAILASVWKAPDGNLAIVLTNISSKKLKFEFELDINEYDLSENYILRQLFPDAQIVDIKSSGSYISCEMELDSLDIKLIEMELKN